jgi:hypothetical protein
LIIRYLTKIAIEIFLAIKQSNQAKLADYQSGLSSQVKFAGYQVKLSSWAIKSSSSAISPSAFERPSNDYYLSRQVHLQSYLNPVDDRRTSTECRELSVLIGDYVYVWLRNELLGIYKHRLQATDNQNSAGKSCQGRAILCFGKILELLRAYFKFQALQTVKMAF